MSTIKNIVVPCDGSEHAAQAAVHAAMLAKAFGAKLHLVHVFPGSPAELIGMPGASAQMVGVGRFDEKTFRRMWDDAAKASLEAAHKALGEAGADAKAVKLSGDPADEIIKFAHGLDAPAIVIGPRGLGTVRGMLLGSVSNRVVHKAKCPVTVVH
ncbi:nucleotide-binding universal stress UspA family protein [Natronocella acetinitrilica]|uniref:Nucleotide-binding universal stress UspA family protein n=1 Tax=Natronocella acetinitrilica TaxID=414046 RepID=A0AAE3G1Q5_9GAMM|nr:universal stress protein [Natronocella acetinitrilica]MCP1674025.1 nucleotide-binding universal stress UspA family protein [Natronocella acetinitrilica]